MPITTFVALVVVGVFGTVLFARRVRARYARRARQAGYESIRAFLRAAPQSDEERRDAVDDVLKGGVICLLGLLFPPLVLFGLFPLFFGARKVAYASLGLGLVDETPQSSE